MVKASAAVPDDKDFRNPAEWFVRAAERAKEKEGWASGLAVADIGLKAVSAGDAAPLREWQSGVYRRWSQELLGQGDVDGSLKVLTTGAAALPGNRDLAGGVAFHTQEALADLYKKRGPASALKHFRAVREAFPDNKEVGEVGASHARCVVDRLAGAKEFAAALKAADEYKPLAGDDATELLAIVYDRWGRSLAAGGEWKDALDKYAEGLKACPGNGRLANNAVATVDGWAGVAMNEKKWEEAAGVYDIGLTYLPGNSHLEHNRTYCRSQLAKSRERPLRVSHSSAACSFCRNEAS